MATQPNSPLLPMAPGQAPQPAPPAGIPNPDQSRLIGSPFGLSDAERDARAKEVYEYHRRAKQRRKLRDLTAEKYDLHIDGEGDGQWADIVNGRAVVVPPDLSGGLRLQDNLLRPMVENMVAYHTSIPFRAVAQAAPDREARDRARVDTLFANHIIETQRVNELFADALMVGAPYGHGLVHAAWRDDLTFDAYDTIGLPPDVAKQVGPGFVDCWTGDPWSTIYNEGATRRSVTRMSYVRILPAEMVRTAFSGIAPWAAKLEGRDNLSSASRHQRTARKWLGFGRWGHGFSQIFGGEPGGQELVAVIFDEILPGVLPDYKDGRLTIVGLSGVSDPDRLGRSQSGAGTPMLLFDGVLPGRRLSAVRVYAGFRGDDPLGKPYVADLDDDQVQLNQLVTLRAEFLAKFPRPPLMLPEGSNVDDDSAIWAGDAIIPFSGATAPQFAYPPATAYQLFNAAIEDVRNSMFRKGGWQAASRGESNPGDAAAKVVALARADDSVFSSVNRGMQGSVVEFLQLCHALYVRYASGPTLAQITGNEHGYLADPWIRAEQMSDEPPNYTLVSATGTTPEARQQMLLAMAQAKSADGRPILPVDEMWKRWPDPSMRPQENGADTMRQTRPQAINYAIKSACEQQDGGGQMPPQWIEQAAMQLHAQLMGQYPPLDTDVIPLHIDALDEFVQDEQAPQLVRRVAWLRQHVYMGIAQQRAMAALAQQQAMASPTRPGAPAGRDGAPAQAATKPPAGPAPQNAPGGTPTAGGLQQVADSSVPQLTRQAANGG